MDLSNKDDLITRAEKANFILLSLYREYAKQILENRNVSFATEQMQKIKKDLMYLEQTEMIAKADNVYAPLLKRMIG